MAEIKIISLGGVRENGKNMYVAEIDDALFVLDCGLVYPEEEMLGIDLVISDFSYLEENADKIAGIFLTHGHDDAVGALPYLLKNMKVPVFGTELTIALAKIAVKDQGLKNRIADFHVIDEETEIDFGHVIVSFFKTTHTVPDSVGICLKTDVGSIVYTGDFRFDQSASELYRTDYRRLVEIGQSGVLALLSDSSNADSHVETISERKIADEVLDTFRNVEGRIIASCVASNLLRVQQVINAAYESGRKVFLTGRSVVEIIDVALRLKKLVLPSPDVLVKLSELNRYEDNQIVILETGQKGDPINVLKRMAQGKHPQVNLKEGDLVYITTTPSVAMETLVARTKDWIYKAGATVKSVTDNFKVSGHATPNDLKLLMNLLQPEYVVPVSGEYRMLEANAQAAIEVGIPQENIFLLRKGDVLQYKLKEMHLAGEVPTGNVLIDGIGVGDIGNIVLRDRKILSEDGILVAVTTISRRLGKLLARPKIITRGFVYLRTNTDIIPESSELVTKVIERHLASDEFDWAKLRQEVRDELSQFLFEKTKRRPVVLPIIMEASSYKHPDEE